MMVMTRVSERPVTEPAGTMGADVTPGGRNLAGALPTLREAPRKPGTASPPPREGAGELAADGGVSDDLDMALVQLQSRRLELFH
jgi:hypothetical protein